MGSISPFVLCWFLFNFNCFANRLVKHSNKPGRGMAVSPTDRLCWQPEIFFGGIPIAHPCTAYVAFTMNIPLCSQRSLRPKSRMLLGSYPFHLHWSSCWLVGCPIPVQKLWNDPGKVMIISLEAAIRWSCRISSQEEFPFGENTDCSVQF